MNFLIRPEGWVIPEAATAIHGISQEDASAYGLTIKGALSVFSRMCMNANVLVAHNIGFDLKMLEIECDKARIPVDLPSQSFCTMGESTDIVKIPPTAKMQAAGMTRFKSPNLQEAHEYFMGFKFEGAHDAMADVRACKAVYFAILKQQFERKSQCKVAQ